MEFEIANNLFTNIVILMEFKFYNVRYFVLGYSLQSTMTGTGV